MHYSRRRLLRRGLEFHVCTINKSAYTKKSENLLKAPRKCHCVTGIQNHLHQSLASQSSTLTTGIHNHLHQSLASQSSTLTTGIHNHLHQSLASQSSTLTTGIHNHLHQSPASQSSTLTTGIHNHLHQSLASQSSTLTTGIHNHLHQSLASQSSTLTTACPTSVLSEGIYLSNRMYFSWLQVTLFLVKWKIFRTPSYSIIYLFSLDFSDHVKGLVKAVFCHKRTTGLLLIFSYILKEILLYIKNVVKVLVLYKLENHY